MKATWESWVSVDGTDVTFVTANRVDRLKASGLMPADAVLQYSFDAMTSEEALAIHHLRQGFEPYKPIGESAECPQCSAWYYPDGSGECWRCG